MSEPNLVGRPALPTRKKCGKLIPARVSLVEYREVIAVIEPAGVKNTEWIRMKLVIASLCFWLALASISFAEDDFHAGFLFDESALTLDQGHRAEAVGPFFYDQQRDTENVWAVPPLFSFYNDPAVEAKEFDFLYPVMNYDRYGNEYRWQFFQLLSFAGGDDPRGFATRRFTIFPIYFQQRSSETNENYTALLPFYGHLKRRLFKDDISFVMLPIYLQTTKKEVVTDNYLFPIFHLRHGNGVNGWQVWPLVGDEHKILTSKTNGFGDVEIIGGYHKFFALWPFYFWQNNNLGTTNEEKMRAALPFYSLTRSPSRDATTVIWPFFSWIEDRDKKYDEWEGPWPFVVVARGEGKTTTRIWPLFGRSHNESLEKNFYLWPLYRFKGLYTASLDERQTRIMFYLYEDMREKNLDTGKEKRRVDAWPFFTWHRDFNGNSRLQILALLEPVLPNNRGIERNWSPLWSLWRAEKNPKTGATSQSLLWNLYRHDATPTSKKCSLLFGLFQYQSDTEMKRLRLLYIPVFKSHTAGLPNTK